MFSKKVSWCRHFPSRLRIALYTSFLDVAKGALQLLWSCSFEFCTTVHAWSLFLLSGPSKSPPDAQAPTVAAAPANIVCIASDDDDVDTKHSDANWTFNNPLVASGSPSTVLGSIRLDDVLQLDSNEVSVSQAMGLQRANNRLQAAQSTLKEQLTRAQQTVGSDTSGHSPDSMPELRKQLDQHRRLSKPDGIPHLDLVGNTHCVLFVYFAFFAVLSCIFQHFQLDSPQPWQGVKCCCCGATNLHYPNVVLKKGRRDLIEAEADKLWQLNHRNIARAYVVLHSQEVDSDHNPVAYIALDRLGPSLQERLDSPQMFTVQEVVVGFYGVACALAHMHSKGLVDPDLAPENVMLSQNGTTWVKADLGTAAWMECDGRPNKIAWGPLNWEPPEVAKALLEQRLYQPQPSSDMWSLGQLMLYTVSGSVPYEQWELQNSDAYLQDIGPRCLRPADLPAPRRHLEYLDKLLVDAGSRDYADEVWYPDELEGPPDRAEAQLKHVIWRCLRSRPEDRPTACQAQAALHDIMQQFAWSSSLADVVAAEPSQ
ncbi:hypothetical protein ABBQ38_007747 [Trebouxia sp. C0009 RCD-2024]